VRKRRKRKLQQEAKKDNNLLSFCCNPHLQLVSKNKTAHNEQNINRFYIEKENKKIKSLSIEAIGSKQKKYKNENEEGIWKKKRRKKNSIKFWFLWP
jgi:hypothetical protein